MLLPDTLVNYYFEKICSIPHISKYEKEIANYIVDIAHKYDHYVEIDDIYNVLVIMDPSKGYEDKESIMFQAHLDMVGTKTKDSNFDFINDSLELELNNNILTAKNTTLGADDGVGVAIMLAIISDIYLKHPRIELLFTVQEEIGTIGASHFDISKTISNRLINLDGCGEDKITVGCYCSDKVIISKLLNRINEDINCYKYEVSGFEAYGKRTHPIKVMLDSINPYINYINIVDIKCGVAENMPATSISFAIRCNKDISNKIYEYINNNYTVNKVLINSSYYYSNDLIILLNNLIDNIKEGTLKEDDKNNMISTFMLGMININNDILELIGSYRCLNDDIKNQTKKIFIDIANKYNCKLETKLRYKSWPYNKDSKLKKEYNELFFNIKGYYPSEEICPGGLEVTDFMDKRNNLDVLSLGVNCGGFHSTNEYLDIDSMNRMYDLLTKLISK